MPLELNILFKISQMDTIKKIENISLYMQEFNILSFVDSINIFPSAWSNSRTGRDDSWGVNLIYSNTIKADGYLLLNNLITHKELGESWEITAYSSGSSMIKSFIEQGGMYREWAKAKKIKGEMAYKILNGYNKCEHESILNTINDLSEIELQYLNEIYKSKISKLHYNQNKNSFSAFKTFSSDFSFEERPIINILIKKLILRDLQIIVESDGEEKDAYTGIDFLNYYKKTKVKIENTHNLTDWELTWLKEIIAEEVTEIEYLRNYPYVTFNGKINNPQFNVQKDVIIKFLELNLLDHIKLFTVSLDPENDVKFATSKEFIEYLKTVDGKGNYLSYWRP
jgi:hypothetical protein